MAFGSLFSSRSKSSNTTNNDIKNYNLQGVTGETVIAGNGNSVTTTDHGAISGAMDLATQSVSSNQLVSMAAMEQSADVAEMGMGYVYDAAKMSVNTANKSAEAVGDAWRSSSSMVVDSVSDAWKRSSSMAVNTATDAAQLVAETSAANSDKIMTLSGKNADRVEKMAAAVATNGQNLMAESNRQNLYVIAGVSVAAVLGFAVIAGGKR